MKKLLLTTAVLLPCLLAHSQELKFVPRLEASPVFSTGGEEHNFSFPDILGETSLYSFFEGDISDHFSFFVCNHWLSTDPVGLYKDTFFYSNTNNWLDFLYFTYKTGWFSLTLGKDVIHLGGWEYDPYDVYCHSALMSSQWNGLPAYQWGASMAFDLPWEDNSIDVQMVSSPFGERTFASGLFTWALRWCGSIGPWSPIWGVALFQDNPADRAHLIPVVDISNRFALNDNFRLDLSYRYGVGGNGDEFPLLSPGHVGIAELNFTDNNEKVDVFAKGIYEYSALKGHNWIAGGGIHWYPLRNSQNLRVYATAGWDRFYQNVTASAGLSYDLVFKLWK